MRTVGVDIGGSGVRAARVDPEGRLGDVVRQSLTSRGVEAVVEAAATVAGELGAERLGVGVPGFVRGQTVVASPNFPEWRDVPLAEALAERLQVPVFVENDANAAAMGAWRTRGGRRDLVLLTLGTGVGGGVVTDGRLLRGAGGTGAELGHIFVGGDVPCPCGGVGCLEQWCSTVGLVRQARDAGREVSDGRAVVAAAEAGEDWAELVLAVAGRHLGVGLTTLVNVFNPDEVVLAGGLSAARRWLEPPATEWLRSHGIAPSVERVQLVWLGPADHLAIAGAAEVARQGGR